MPYREVPPINCDTSTRLPCLQRSPFRVGSYITWQSQVPQATVSTRHWLWVTESLTTGVIKQSLLPRIPYGSYLPTAHESHELGPSPTSAATCSSDFFYPGGRCTASHDPHRIHSESSWVMKSCWCILPQKRYRLCMHAKRSYFDTIQSWLQYLMISRVLFKYVPDHIKTYQDSRQHDLQAARSKVASSHQHTHFGISLWIPTSNG